jgi:hypothetical protein
MRFPLSMDFAKLISRTGDVDGQKRPKARYTLTQPGLLTPDREYSWRVRAMDRHGVWGPWSRTWRFTPRGPAPPEGVTVAYDPAAGRGVLRWRRGDAGRAPSRYRVYGSDEKGFTVADRPSQGTVGVTKAEMASWDPWFPPNFLAETTATELTVIGPEVDPPSASTVYYRVVAVDDRGKRSGPSDYATAPRPVVSSRPVTTAEVGSRYRYRVRATRSLGDLSARMRGGEQVSGYFDVESPRFALRHAPPWLAIDGVTGMLSGTPDAAGTFEVEVAVTIDREVRRLDEGVLAWGSEKILSTSAERVGEATQRFEIDVRGPAPAPGPAR